MLIKSILLIVLTLFLSTPGAANQPGCNDISIWHEKKNCSQRFMLYLSVLTYQGMPHNVYSRLRPMLDDCKAAHSADPDDQSYFVFNAPTELQECRMFEIEKYDDFLYKWIYLDLYNENASDSVMDLMGAALEFQEKCQGAALTEEHQAVIFVVVDISSDRVNKIFHNLDVKELEELMRKIVATNTVVKLIFSKEKTIHLESLNVSKFMTQLANYTDHYVTFAVDDLQDEMKVRRNYGMCTPQPPPTFEPRTARQEEDGDYLTPLKRTSKKWIWGVAVGGVVLLLLVSCFARPVYRYLKRLWYKKQLDDQDLYAIVRKDEIFATVRPVS